MREGVKGMGRVEVGKTVIRLYSLRVQFIFNKKKKYKKRKKEKNPVYSSNQRYNVKN